MKSSCSRSAASPGDTLRRVAASVAGEGGKSERSGSGLPRGRIGAGVVPRQPGGMSAPGPRPPENIERPAPPHPPALPCVCGCPSRCHRRVPGRLAPSGVPSIAREGNLLRLRHERIPPADADSERLGGLPDRGGGDFHRHPGIGSSRAAGLGADVCTHVAVFGRGPDPRQPALRRTALGVRARRVPRAGSHCRLRVSPRAASGKASGP